MTGLTYVITLSRASWVYRDNFEFVFRPKYGYYPSFSPTLQEKACRSRLISPLRSAKFAHHGKLTEESSLDFNNC